MCRCLWRRSRKCIWRGGGDDWRRRCGCLGRVQFESSISKHVLRHATGRRGRGRRCGRGRGRGRGRLAHWSDASRPFLSPDEAKTGEDYCGNGADDGGNDDEDCTIGARACRVARFDEGRLRGRGCGRRRRRGRRRREGRDRCWRKRGLGCRGHVSVRKTTGESGTSTSSGRQSLILTPDGCVGSRQQPFKVRSNGSDGSEAPAAFWATTVSSTVE